MAALCLLTMYLFGFNVSYGWDYGHPDNWHQAYPDCDAADESPINIETKDAITDTERCNAEFDWEIDYNHKTFKIINNAHSLQVVALGLNEEENANYTASKNLDEYTRLSSNYDTIASFPNYLRPKGQSGHRLYCLDSFHFHWGQTSDYGSEHTINGQRYPLEAHFLHFACDSINLLQAVDDYENSPDPDYHVLAVVGIVFEISEENNPAIDVLLNDSVLHRISLPDDLSTPNITGYDIVNDLDLSQLIPSNIYDAGYYEYEGSLTTPPCTDVVRWYFAKAVGTISEEQLWRFRVLLNSDGKRITRNYREIQNNANEIYNCGDDEEMTSTSSISKLSSTSIISISLALSLFVLAALVIILTKYNKRRKRQLSEEKSMTVIKDYGINTQTVSDENDNGKDNYVLMYSKDQK